MKRRDFIKSVATIAALAPIASHKAIADLTHNSNTTERNNKMKKVIILNASPRTNFNTAKMLKEAHKKEMLEKQFPKDLEKAFDLGKRLTELKLN